MNRNLITFSANEQTLIKTGGINNYASNTVSYIVAEFDLGENWDEFDSVRAIFQSDFETAPAVLAHGSCVVPFEVLRYRSTVRVNLVGSVAEQGVLIDRLTTFPITALNVTADALVDNSIAPISPSEFEEFVAMVKDDADRAEAGAESAESSASAASTSAQSAEDSALSASNSASDASASAQTAQEEAQKITGMVVVVTQLPEGATPTSDWSDGVLIIGIPKGDTGDTGETGNGIESAVLNANYTLTLTFTDGTSYTTPSIRGATGATGATGNGISSVTLTSTSGAVKTYTIAFTDGTNTTFDVTDGEVTQAVLDEEITALKSELNNAYEIYGNIVRGYYAKNGNYVSSETNRLTTKALIPVKRGQQVYLDSGSLYYGVQIWGGNPTEASALRYESAVIPPTTEKITVLNDGYITFAFRNASNTTISADDFDGEIKVCSPQIDALNREVSNLKNFVDDVLPFEYDYSKYINTSVGATYSLGSSDAFNLAFFNIEPNTKYFAQTLGRPSTTKYFGFVDVNNKVISYIEKTPPSDGSVVSVEFTSPPNAVKLFINSTYGFGDTYKGSTVKYIWLKKQWSENKWVVSKEQMRLVESAKKTFTSTPTLNYAGNPLPTFVHVTDIHSDAVRFGNAVKIADEIGADAILNTGDSVRYYSTDDASYIETAMAETSIPMLPTIGNHDSYTLTEQGMYEKFIQPFESGLTLDSEVTYPTYYYKDFSAHKLRIISVNQFQYRGVSNYTTERNYHQEQIEFFCDALLNVPSEYGVIVLLHTPEKETSKSSGYGKFYQDEVMYNNVAGEISPIYEIVDAFISGTRINKSWNNISGNTPATFSADTDFSNKNSGAEFIAYCSGHMHRDAVYYVSGMQNKQLMLNEVCTNAWSHMNEDGTSGSNYPYFNELTDLPRVIGSVTENAVNVYSVDRVHKRVRIVRIGSDAPCDLDEKRDYLSISYAD